MTITADPVIRRELRDGDAEAIADLHRRVYGAEYGTNEPFVSAVAEALRCARDGGWPREGGGVWLVHHHGRLCGSLGLTRERPHRGQVRWFVFEPVLRGRGLGRRLVTELIELARAQGMRELQLDTFSELTAAAHLYRAVGFRVVSERPRADWGIPMTYQHYELELSG